MNRDELLQAILSGEIDEKDPRIVQAMKTEGFRNKYEELRKVATALALEEKEREAILHEMTTYADENQERAAIERFREIATSHDRPDPRGLSRRRVLSIWRVGAFAALTLVAIWIPWNRLFEG